MKYVLTIAGSDPTGGAGIQRDIETILELGKRPLSVVTSVTVQSPLRVITSKSLPARLVREQLVVILKEFSPDAIKIGLTGSASVIDALYDVLKEKSPVSVVLDPVIKASSGYMFVRGDGLRALKRLLSVATMVTPNLYEAEVLSGVSIRDDITLRKAAERILSSGCSHVLIKGGHLKGPPVDTLFDGKKVYTFGARRLPLSERLLHGTGCILSGAIACHLAEGTTAVEAVKRAKGYLEGVLRGRARRGGT